MSQDRHITAAAVAAVKTIATKRLDDVEAIQAAIMVLAMMIATQAPRELQADTVAIAQRKLPDSVAKISAQMDELQAQVRGRAK